MLASHGSTGPLSKLAKKRRYQAHDSVCTFAPAQESVTKEERRQLVSQETNPADFSVDKH